MSWISLLLGIIFWACILGLIHTYFIFPFLTKQFRKGKTLSKPQGELPFATVLMAAHNEESVLDEKLNSLVQQDYPKDKFEIRVGSDCSTDRTIEILENFSKEYPSLSYHDFRERQGKPGIINRLFNEATSIHGKGQNHIIIITDASVMLRSDVISKLAHRFLEPEIGLVDTRMVNKGLAKEGISKSEDQYISGEVSLKHAEGERWGLMMGPFGGCYAVRSDLFTPVPDTYLVDDFFIALGVLDKGAKTVSELGAICTEEVSHKMSEEFRRKKRISAGNFQNLSHYKHLLSPKRGKLAYVFLSHKVLRWFGPFFVIFGFISCGILAGTGNLLYLPLFILYIFLMVDIPILDFLLQKIGIHVRLLRSIRYFFIMNLALLAGFFQYLKGIKSNVWQPTERNR